MSGDSLALGVIEAALLGLALLLPLGVSLCLFRLCCRSQGFLRVGCCSAKPEGCVEVLPTLSEDEEAAAGQPIVRRRSRALWSGSHSGGAIQRLPSTSPSAKCPEAPRLIRCYFHTTPRRRIGQVPVVLDVPLEDVQTVQELHEALRMACSSSGASPHMALLDGEPEILRVQYQNSRSGKRVPLSGNVVDVRRTLARVHCLHVTPMKGRDERPRASLRKFVLGVHEEEPPSPSRAEPRAARSISAMRVDDTELVDVSLAGCCGVQSCHGGLAITSSYAAQNTAELVNLEEEKGALLGAELSAPAGDGRGRPQCSRLIACRRNVSL